MKKIVLIVGLIYQTLLGYGQGENSIAASVIHTNRIFSAYSIPLQGNCYGGEVQYHITMIDNEDEWARFVKDISLNVLYLNTAQVSLKGVPNSKGVIGDNVALTVSAHFYVLNTNNTTATVSIGGGAGYFCHTFWQDKKNNLINGSHINAMFEIGLHAQQQVYRDVAIFIEVHGRHSSTAGLSQPNSGINVLDYSFGIVKMIDVPGPLHQNYVTPIEHQSSFDISLGAAVRDEMKTGLYKNIKTHQNEFYDTTGQKSSHTNLWQTDLSAGYTYRPNTMIAFKITIDGVYTVHPFTYDNFLGTYQGSFSSYSHVTLGGAVGGELFLGRLGLTGMVGKYAYGKFLHPHHYYWSPAVSYAISEHFAVRLKTVFQGQEPHYPSAGLTYSSGRLF